MHLHLPDSAAAMSPQQLAALGGQPIGDIEDLGSRPPSSGELFAPATHAATRRPLLMSSTMRGEVYSSQKWLDAEVERVFAPAWTLVGRLDEVPEPGDFLTIETLALGPVAVVRSREADGRLHAFANVCCHRGAKVIRDERGSATSVGFICPYHAWTYDVDGQLLWAPGTEPVEDFDTDSLRMQPLRVETFAGFIFVCADPHAPSVQERLGDLPQQLPEWFAEDGAAHGMVCAGRADFEVDCNWKFVMENTCETCALPPTAPPCFASRPALIDSQPPVLSQTTPLSCTRTRLAR